jgi:hypothetical protein
MSQTINIRTNSNQATAVVVSDMGIEVPALGLVTIVVTTEAGRQDATVSQDLRTLATDAGGGGADGATGLTDTIILTDGAGNPIQNVDVDTFLSNIRSEVSSSPYGLYGSDANGNPASPLPPEEIVRTFVPGVLVQDPVFQTAVAGQVDRADASAGFAGMPVIGFVIGLNDPAPGQCRIQTSGDLGGFAGLVPQKIYIMGRNPGTIVADDDTVNPNYPDTTPGSGHIMQEVGVASSANTLLVGPNRDIMEF